MSRSLTSIRRVSMAIGVVFVSHGALAQTQADPSAQRVAMARTHTAETAHQTVAPVARPAAARRDITTAKLQVRRSSEQRSEGTSSDGSRFVYDSCGCSND
jgi:hypothetical protein